MLTMAFCIYSTLYRWRCRTLCLPVAYCHYLVLDHFQISLRKHLLLCKSSDSHHVHLIWVFFIQQCMIVHFHWSIFTEDKGLLTSEASKLRGPWLFKFTEFPSLTVNLTVYYKNTLTLKYQPTQFRRVRPLSAQVHTPPHPKWKTENSVWLIVTFNFA